MNIVVLQADEQSFGLMVDEINDTEEIVVKPLGKLLKGVGLFAGATIMGDGRVALILDVLGAAQGAGVVSKVRDRTPKEEDVAGPAGPESGLERQTLLLFGVAGGRRMALPLSLIARLEEFPESSVERAGRQEVVQYRGRIMPLIRLSDVVDGASQPGGRDPIQVVVYPHQGQSVGLVVDNILDIVEESLTLHRGAAGGLVLGSAVIQGKVTDLLDVPAVIEASRVTTFEAMNQLAGAGV